METVTSSPVLTTVLEVNDVDDDCQRSEDAETHSECDADIFADVDPFTRIDTWLH